MKQTVHYLGFDAEDPLGDLSPSGLVAAHEARSRSVKALFGLWLGMFSYAAVSTLVDQPFDGGAIAGQGIWLQLVVLGASVLFYLAAKPLRHPASVSRMLAIPVALSLGTCVFAFGFAMMQAGPAGVAPQSDASFWAAVRAAHFGDAFPGRAIEVIDGGANNGAALPAIYTVRPTPGSREI